MSEPVVFLDSHRVAAEIGGQTGIKVRIKNPGKIVEGYRLEVLGEPAAWAEIVPAEVSVYPDDEASSTVVFTPSQGGRVPSGSIPFAVKVESTIDPDNRVVVEGQIDIGQQFCLQAVLRPITSRGRWRGRHILTVSNWGNAGAQLRLAANDPDDALGFLIKPDLLDVPLGGTASARVFVKTRHPQLRGWPVRLPFQVLCEPLGHPRPVGVPVAVGQPERPVVDGAFEQRPILSRATVLIAALTVAVVLAGVGWLVINRAPTAGQLLPAGAADVPTLHATGDPSDPTRPILLQWTAVADVSGYTLREVKQTSDGVVPLQGTMNLGPDDTSVVAPTSAPGRHCYQIQAVRTGSPASAWSTPACAAGGPQTEPSTSASPTSQSATPTPGPSTNSSAAPVQDSWVSAILIGPAGFVDAQAGRLQATLNKKQQTTKFQLVISSAYAGLAAQAPGAVSDFLISASLPSQATAQQVCDTIGPLLTAKNGAGGGITCQPVQLGKSTS